MTKHSKIATENRRRSQRGAAVMVEFILVSVMLTPLVLGSVAIGLGLSRYMQTGSLCRSAASLYVRGTDFNRTDAQRILGKISGNLGLADSSGNVLTTGSGVVILSRIVRIGGAQCAEGGFAPPSYTGCANRGYAVITQRTLVGNSSLRDSSYATPVGGARQSDGSYDASFYLVDPSVRAAGFGVAPADDVVVTSAPVNLAAGEEAYLTETFFNAPELNLFPNVVNLSGYYHKNFF